MSEGVKVTVTLGKASSGYGIKKGDFFKFGKKSKVRGLFGMFTSVYENPEFTQLNCVAAIPSRQKNGFAIDRLRGIHKHKPKKSYFK